MSETTKTMSLEVPGRVSEALPPPPPSAIANRGWKGKLKIALRLANEFKLDISLLIASAICFGLFIEGSVQLKELSGIGGPVATLAKGSADRKATGTTEFVKSSPGAEFFNMDAIWVGKGGHAEFVLDDGQKFEMPEKTLVILKKPFKHIKKITVEEKVKVVKGRVKVTKKNNETETYTASNEKAEEFPALIDPLKRPAAPISLYPSDDALIFKRDKEKVDLTLAWPDPQTGYLVIQNQKNGHTSYTEIKGQKYGKATVEQDSRYYWQIIDSNKKVLVGPYRFELRELDEKTAKETLRQNAMNPPTGDAPPRKIEIFW